MKKCFFLIAVFQISFWINAQNDSSEQEKGTVDIWNFIVEEMPHFIGGEESLKHYIKTNVIYTNKAREDNVSGIVYISFVVDADGSVLDPVILRGLHRDLDSICIDLVENMPNWIPAIQKGKPVKCLYNLAIEFTVDKHQKNSDPVPSKYWSKKGKKQFLQKCLHEFGKSTSECDCWYNFIVWNYNTRKLADLELELMFEKQKCQ